MSYFQLISLIIYMCQNQCHLCCIFQKQFTTARLDEKVKNGEPRKQYKKRNKDPPKKHDKEKERSASPILSDEGQEPDEAATKTVGTKKRVLHPEIETHNTKTNVSYF